MSQQTSGARIRHLVPAGVLTLVVLLLAGATAWSLLRQTSRNRLAGVSTITDLAADHVPGPVRYSQTPPAGGPHNPVWLNCGIYTTPVPPENAVHSMEHGAVWITYRPDLPADRVGQLQQLVRGQPYLILSPYPGLPATVVASAWGKQLRLAEVDIGRLRQFIVIYQQGPQTREIGGSCGNGTGTPIG